MQGMTTGGHTDGHTPGASAASCDAAMSMASGTGFPIYPFLRAVGDGAAQLLPRPGALFIGGRQLGGGAGRGVQPPFRPHSCGGGGGCCSRACRRRLPHCQHPQAGKEGGGGAGAPGGGTAHFCRWSLGECSLAGGKRG